MNTHQDIATLKRRCANLEKKCAMLTETVNQQRQKIKQLENLRRLLSDHTPVAKTKTISKAWKSTIIQKLHWCFRKAGKSLPVAIEETIEHVQSVFSNVTPEMKAYTEQQAARIYGNIEQTQTAGKA